MYTVAELSSLETSVQGRLVGPAPVLQFGPLCLSWRWLTAERLSEYLNFVEAELSLQCPRHHR